jgi:hypothetical protein
VDRGISGLAGIFFATKYAVVIAETEVGGFSVRKRAMNADDQQQPVPTEGGSKSTNDTAPHLILLGEELLARVREVSELVGQRVQQAMRRSPAPTEAQLDS